jgi:hypothetical protein
MPKSGAQAQSLVRARAIDCRDDACTVPENNFELPVKPPTS